MGLFDLFKKKPKITIETKVRANEKEAHYDPWDKTKENSNTTYANVVFLYMLSHRPNLISKKADDFPRYVSYQWGIHDPIRKQNDLLRNGMLREATASEILCTYKVDELKAILEAHGLQTKGRKAELITRISESVNSKDLHLPAMCCVSDDGLAFIEQNKDLIELSRNPYGITYDEYIATKKNSPSHLSYSDILWGVLNRRETFASSYADKQFNAQNRAKFLRNEGKLVGALEHYIYVLFYELNAPSRVIPESIKKYYEKDEIQPQQISKDILESIYQLQDNFMPEMIERCYSRIDVPNVLIKRKNFERLIADIFASKQIDVRNYLPNGLR